MKSDIITLTTDFGLADEYVGVMKGVILARAPQARIVDLSHAVGRRDIRRAAEVLAAAVPYFPAGAIHVAVVDPGVGTNRRIVLLETSKHLFLAPDNGILSPFFAKTRATAHAVTNDDLFLHPISHTFHGRDIFAPVAAALRNGLPPSEAGERLALRDLVTFARPQAEIAAREKQIKGQITAVDHFGNLITNISQAAVSRLRAGNETMEVRLKGRTITGILSTYGSGPPGTLIALFGSRGNLEIAVNQGDASQALQARIGDPVLVLGRNPAR